MCPTTPANAALTKDTVMNEAHPIISNTKDKFTRGQAKGKSI